MREPVKQIYDRFNRKFARACEWEKLGWQAVPILNGDGLSSWESFEAVHFKNKRLFACVDDIPYEISCQSLITWKRIPNCLAKKSMVGLKDWVKRKAYDVPVKNCKDNFFGRTKGWAMDFSQLVDMEVPSYLDLQEQSSIITWGGWFTEGHVEIAGDESVECVYLGKKAFLIAKRGPASKFLTNQTKWAKEFMKFVERGPPTRYKNKIF